MGASLLALAKSIYYSIWLSAQLQEPKNKRKDLPVFHKSGLARKRERWLTRAILYRCYDTNSLKGVSPCS